jgi:hypothetical protein
MNMINKISALAGKLLSMIGIDGKPRFIGCQSPHYSMPEFGYVAIKIYSAMVSGRYNRCDLYSEGNIRQVL